MFLVHLLSVERFKRLIDGLMDQVSTLAVRKRGGGRTSNTTAISVTFIAKTQKRNTLLHAQIGNSVGRVMRLQDWGTGLLRLQ